MKQLKYALSLGTMLSLPIMASAVEITTTGAATPIQQQDAYNLAHQYSPTQAQRFTAQISQNKSNWFWNASTSVAQNNNKPHSREYVKIKRDDKENYAQRYINFPNLITTGIPILGKALETSINKALHKRITKTELHYARVEAFNRLQAYAETVQQNNPELYESSADVTDALHQNRLSTGLFNQTALNQPHRQSIGFTSFDSTIHHDVASVLDHYNAVRTQPGVRLRGELGYKTNSFEWRMGLQKQKTDGMTSSTEPQKRKSFYSAASWDISERLNYFNVFTQEKFKNRFGLEGFSNDATAHYHRLSYALNENTNIFIGKGRTNDDLLGQVEQRHSGVQNCTELRNIWNICSSVSYQITSYGADSSQVMSDKKGAHLALTAKMNF